MPENLKEKPLEVSTFQKQQKDDRGSRNHNQRQSRQLKNNGEINPI
jgi:hypothetical protein